MEVTSKQYTVGIVSLVSVVVLWVASSFVTKDILDGFNRPFLMTFLSCASFQLYFGFLFLHDPLTEFSGQAKDPKKSTEPSAGVPLTMKETAKLALAFFPLYFAATYFSNASFAKTSVSSATIIASTCGFFTLIIGAFLGTERLSLLKLFAVAIRYPASTNWASFLGVVLLSSSKNELEETRLSGNICALVGALLYGCYSGYLKKTLIDESRVRMPFLFAFTGLYTCLGLWPLFFLLNYLEIEPASAPQSLGVGMAIALNTLLGSLLPNYLWNVAFVFTSPLIVALGISCNLPLTLLVEYLLTKTGIRLEKLISAALIIVGFIIVNVASLCPSWDCSMACRRKQTPTPTRDVLE